MYSKARLVVLVSLIFLIGLPMLLMNWSLVDDGVIILRAKQISALISSLNFSGLLNLFIERDIGRFRPVYYLSYWLVYLVGGTNVFVYYLSHFLVFGAIIWLIYKISRSLFDSNVGFWAVFFFLVSYLNTENWYRLGPQESLMVVYFLLSFYCFLLVFLKKSSSSWLRLLAYLFLALAFLTKETGIAFILPLSILFVSLKFLKIRDKSVNKSFNLSFLRNYLLFNFLIGLIILGITTSLRFEGAYTSNYVIGGGILIANLKSYLRLLTGSFFPVFPLVFLIFSFFLLKKFFKMTVKTQDLWATFFLFWFLLFLLVQCPWRFTLSRYLMPSLVGLAIFMALAISSSEKFLKNPLTRRIFVGGLIVFLLLLNFPQNFNTITSSIIGTRASESVLDYVARAAPANSTVYFNFVKGDATIELVVESELHFNLLLGRPDLKAVYLEESSTFLPKTLIVSAFVSDNFLFYPSSKLEENLELEKEKTFQYTFLTLERPSFLELKNWLFYQTPINLSPAKIIQRREVNWAIYQKI